MVTFLAAVTKYPTKQLKGQSTYLGSPVGGATRPGKEGMTSGARGSWSHDIHSQDAER